MLHIESKIYEDIFLSRKMMSKYGSQSLFSYDFCANWLYHQVSMGSKTCPRGIPTNDDLFWGKVRCNFHSLMIVGLKFTM